MKGIASGLIALMLLFFYVLLVIRASDIARCIGRGATCNVHDLAPFNDTMAHFMSVLNGLVSALIISELAVAKPGQAPGERLVAVTASSRAKNILRWVTWLYVAVWVFVGGWAFWVGINYPGAVASLVSVGTAWFGLALISVYAYFGINPT